MSVAACEYWLKETHAEPHVTQNGDAFELKAIVEHEAGPKSDLEAVILRVHPDSWRVEGMQLTFGDSIFDVSEMDLTILKTDELSPDLLAQLDLITPRPAPKAPVVELAVAAPPAIVSAPPEPSLPSSALSEIELQVRFRLHEIGADLSEPIDVKKRNEEIVIDARGASRERKQQLTEMFAAKEFGDDPRIRLEVEANTSPRSETATPVILAAATRRTESTQLMAFFGTAEAQENFTRAVLGTDASLLARLYALRNLVEHWPPDTETSLSDDARRKLYAMVEDHSNVLRSVVPELKQSLMPLLNKVCEGSSIADIAPGQMQWQQSSANALRAARSLDRNLRAMLTSSASEVPMTDVCPELSAALGILQSSVTHLPPKRN